MSMPLLVRHPPPYPTESLLGYVLRVSEGNGYNSPWSVYCLAGMKSNEIRASRVKLKKLARVTNWPQEKLDAIAYSAPAGQPRWSRLLGNPVLPQDLNLTLPRFCPQCASEKGFLEAHWDLALMVACPVHQCSLAASCPQCGRHLRWFRRGLLECACGGDLSGCDLSSISEAEAGLLQIIRTKALSCPPPESNPMGLPQDQLTAMSLRSMLLAIRTLGKHRIKADGLSDRIMRRSSWLLREFLSSGRRISLHCWKTSVDNCHPTSVVASGNSLVASIEPCSETKHWEIRSIPSF